MFVLHLGLWVKKHDDLSLFERELLQWNTVIKVKIATMFSRNPFKIYHFIFSMFLKEESEILIQKDFGHVKCTLIA